MKNTIEAKKYYSLALMLVLLCGACKSIAKEEFPATSDNNQVREEQPVNRGQMLPITAQAIFKDTIINLEVAATREQQAMGLMFRDALPEDRGMYFPFAEARIARFWMNNVPVALDMVFLKEGQVKAIAESAPPCTTEPQDCPLYGPDTTVDGVIELRSGRAKELGLKVGDRIVIQALENEQ